MTEHDDDRAWEESARREEAEADRADMAPPDDDPGPLEPPEDMGWEVEPVETPESAEFALAELRRLRFRIGEAQGLHEAWVAKYDRWLEETAGPLVAKATEIEDALIGFWARFTKANPDHPKTRKLPSGVLKAAGQPASVEVDDPVAFLKWAAEHFPELINPGEPKPAVPSPSKQAVKAALGQKLSTATDPDPEGVAVLLGEGEDAEVVPGVRLVKPDPKITVQT